MNSNSLHLAFIMDGNRRWAKQKGLASYKGHQQGYQQFLTLVNHCNSIGIKTATFWAFSTENWKRSKKEVNFLMQFLEEKIREQLENFSKENIILVHLGRKDRIPKNLKTVLETAEEKTSKNTGMVLQIAIDYGGRDEILRAMKSYIRSQKSLDLSSLNESSLEKYLDSHPFNEPDLIIRTGGDKRLSGFLSWQSIYSELYFSDLHFPDFSTRDLDEALEDYHNRKRSFGK